MRTSTAGRFLLLVVLAGLVCLPGGLNAHPRAAASAPQAASAPAGADGGVDPALFSALRYRSIGPYRGGRSTAVAGIAGQPATFYMGTTGGGVWKTTDAGLNWANISDGFFDVASVGAVDVADSDPNVIYVGTGSACIRGNVSIGRGVYKSVDAGKSWTFSGLRDAGQIGRIQVHPDNPDLVYLASLGNPFGANETRGVFRSEDGGETWEKILYVSDTTGAVELSMNPANPREMYAAFWRAERKPWTVIDASEDGGIYKTTDGGDSWKKLGGGLPQGLTGRIGVSVSPANPDRVFALVSAADPEGGIYRSDDAGESWRRINRERNLRTRHWYYSHIIADPVDENTVYVLNSSMYRSIDAGNSFQSIRVGHGDTHDLWIDPTDPERMILGDDGGAEISGNGGTSWSPLSNQPTAEIYRVTVDNQFPYRVYGAQQDNSTLSVASQGRGTQQDWYTVGGCESGHIALDPRDPNIAYAGCYIGMITRYDHASGSRRDIDVYPVLVDGVAPRELEYRFQWNAPIVISPHDPDALYHTSQVVHLSRDGGQSWQTISPDLTTNDPEKQGLPGGPLQHDHTSVEVYNTIFAFVESPHTAGELWAGSDDGLIHLSRDGGANWADVTPPQMPTEGTVNTLDISAHRPGRVIATVYNYRMNDFAPYVFKTEDYGATWDSLTDGVNGIPADTPVRVVREDPAREGLLYAGTEFGMFISFDDGANWQPFQLNLPLTPVTDLRVHEEDLVVSTQGRSFWILDDVTPLHEITDEVAAAPAHLFSPRPAIRGDGRGARQAVIHYYLADEPEGPVSLEILDAAGGVIRSFTGRAGSPAGASQGGRGGGRGGFGGGSRLPVAAGMNRFTWNLQHEGPELVGNAIIYIGYRGGPVAVPSAYATRLTVGDWSDVRPFEVLADPRRPDVSSADLEAQFDLQVRLRDLLTGSHDAIAGIRDVREQATTAARRAAEAGHGADLRERAGELSAKLAEIEESLVQTKSEAGQDPINFPPMLDNQIGYLYRYTVNGYGRPTQAAYERYEELSAELAALTLDLEIVIKDDVARFNEAVSALGLPGIIIPAAPAGGRAEGTGSPQGAAQTLSVAPSQEGGVDFELVQADLLAESGSMTHAWADFDNDGDLDLYVGFRPGQPNRLYRNDGGRFTEIAAAVGVADSEGTRAVAWGDYNADGRLDLYVGYTSGAREDFAKIANRIYRNDGDRFTEVTRELGLELPLGQARQLSWVDFDNDGDVDLFVGFRDIPNMLFRNDDGVFVDVSEAMGIVGSRATMGGVWFDFDKDGDLDLYLGNMDGYANRMYRNDGDRFVDVAPQFGLDSGGRAVDENPGDHDMAGTIRADVADFDNDGDFDIFVTALGGTDGFYRNDDGTFVSVAADFGLAHTAYRGTAAWADFDNDGWIDLYSSGTLYRNDHGEFVDVTPQVIADNVGGYGSLWADFDNDGAMDLALSSRNHYVIRNGLAADAAARSLQVMVLNEDGIHTRAGTEVRLYAAGTRRLLGTRLIETGSGYNAQSVLPVHFGLPALQAVDVEITSMTEDGRKAVLLRGVDPADHAGSYLVVKVDAAGRIVG